MSPKSVLCVVCLALLSASPAHAGDEDRTILLLLKDVPAAPTPEEIVNYTNTLPHAASPPLQAFTVKDAVGSLYLTEDCADDTPEALGTHSRRRHCAQDWSSTFTATSHVARGAGAGIVRIGAPAETGNV